MFLLIMGTVLLLTYLANEQMNFHFQQYLLAYHMNNGGRDVVVYITRDGQSVIIGRPEQDFLSSMHESLIGVGAFISLIGLLTSYALARSITVPLRKLSMATEEIKKGNFDQKVEVESRGEVGQLAQAFNRMSAALAENTRLRQRLLADIAHELKTPLAVIQGNLEGMLEGVVANDKEQLGSLYEETTHLNKLIHDLRDLSLAEAGQLQLDKEPVDISLIVTRALHMLEPLAEEKKIRLESRLAPVPPIFGDSRRINQVLYNLLANALRYTPENGLITVTVSPERRREQDWVMLAVADTGSGIAPADLPCIFNHFYRADTARDRKSGGTGIGLAIVKQLVGVHGGFVEVKSEVGSGSTFYVYLPVKET